MKTVLIGILIVISTLLNAQDYVVTLKNDTLRGKVKILTYDILDRVEVINDKKKKDHFTCIQIKLAFFGNEIYAPVRTEKGYRMMKLVQSGFLSSYLGRRQGSFYYEMPFIVKRDGESTEIPGMGFKKVLGNFLKDCPSLAQKISKDVYGRNDLPKIVTEYNNCLDNQTIARNTPADVEENATTLAIDALKSRIKTSSIPTKEDALDVLNDISDKVKKSKPIPDYMLEGFKNSFKDAPEFKDDVDKVIAMLKSK